MSYVVSARKYRPRRFSEVVGQQHVSQTLKKELQTDQVAHAFLFCGPRGVGKTTCARILAQALNCTHLDKDFEPCGECESCKAFRENASFNIIELDAASNNSVENIRALVEQVRFQPQRGKYKVFIIDEVHMLSSAAFNAFLKTLEEPPPYAIFILATTERHKILPTILSRCQVFDFRRITVPAITDHLSHICEQENIKAEREALHIIAQKADGALRDALSVFDRVVSASGGKITYEATISSLNVLDYEYYFRITDALLVQDLAQVMLIFEEVLQNGFDGDLFVNGLAEHFRNLLLCKHKELSALIEAGEELSARYQAQSAASPASFLLTVLNLCNDCDVNYKMARNKRLHVEIHLIKMCFANQAVKLAREQIKGVAPANEAEKKSPELSGKVPSRTPGQKNPPSVKSSPSEISEGTAPSAAPDHSPSVASQNAPTDYATPSPEPQEQLAREETPGTIPSGSALDAGTPTKNLRQPRNGQLPSITSLEEVEASVREETTNQVQREALLSEEELQRQWKAYLDIISSHSVKAILRTATASVDGDKVVVTVGSSLAESAIRQESGLMDFLREKLHAPLLTLTIEVDPVKRAGNDLKVAKPMTDSEKYQQMKAVNPLVDALRKRFELNLDNE